MPPLALQLPAAPGRASVHTPRRRRAPLRAAADNGGSFDVAAFEAERSSKDEAARTDMAAAMASAPGAWKWLIRKRIWDFMEKNDFADNPRPVHHRIPNFKAAEAAAERLTALPEFASAQCVKARTPLRLAWRVSSALTRPVCAQVNPDTPQRAVRFAALAAGKTLLTPQPRLRTGFFNTLGVRDLPSDDVAFLREASTSAGVPPCSLLSRRCVLCA
jgi:5-formyltetrahydrofolate cyclo-ligase